ncbi:hypothetical protein [Streptomyces sp. NPDC048172]|uniref:hypothetical protein n=1 Tax=Streptomyces sp. NPDC048172 TaxID=3365505 RepID=UPI00372167A2
MGDLDTAHAATGSRRRRMPASVIAQALVLVLLAGGALLWWQQGQERGCWDMPARTLDLARQPERAARVLDPGTDGTGPDDALVRLLGDEEHWVACTYGSRNSDMGDVLTAATTGVSAYDESPPAVRHTRPMARVLRAAVSVLGARGTVGYGDGFAPYAARLLAAYPSAVNQGIAGVSDEENEANEANGKSGEAMVRFSEDSGDAEALRTVVEDIAADPEAYAVLYDALRAHLAARLDTATGPAGAKEISYQALPALAFLAGARDAHLASGRVADGAAFDRAVLRASRGGYTASPAARTAAPPPPEGAAAHRAPTERATAWARHGARATGLGPGDAARWFMDPERQFMAAVDRWGRDREIPPARQDRVRGFLAASWLRQLDLRTPSTAPGDV